MLASGGKKLPGKCSSVTSSQGLGGFSWEHVKIACGCDGEAGKVELVMTDTGRTMKVGDKEYKVRHILLEKEDLENKGPGFAARFNRWRDRGFGRFRDAYGRVLSLVLAHRRMVMGAAGLSLLFTAALPFVVGLDFFPAVDAGQMRLHFRAPIGTRIEETERLVARLEQRIREIVPPDELQTLNSMIGIPISYNLAFVQTDNIGSQDADVLIALKPSHHPTEEYMDRIRRELPDEFPGSNLYFQPADIVSQVLNFGLSAPIDVQIEGPDVEQSFGVARELAKRIRGIPGATDVRIPQVLAHPALAVPSAHGCSVRRRGPCCPSQRFRRVPRRSPARSRVQGRSPPCARHGHG